MLTNFSDFGTGHMDISVTYGEGGPWDIEKDEKPVFQITFNLVC